MDFEIQVSWSRRAWVLRELRVSRVCQAMFLSGGSKPWAS